MAAPAPLLKGFARTIAGLKPNPEKRITVGDPDTRGLFVRVTPRGRKTFTVVARDPHGKQVWAAIGDCEDMTLDEARERAAQGVRRIKAGLPALPKAVSRTPSTLAEVSQRYLKVYVRKEGQRGERPLRSASEIERILVKYILPRWGRQEITSITRQDVTQLLDELSTSSGPAMADAVLAQLSSLFNWNASRTGDYISPLVRGMKRTKSRERARTRVLDDGEIKSIWETASSLGTFGAFIQIALLTGQRRAKIAGMTWDQIKVDGTWVIPAERGEKGHAGVLQLPALALRVIHSRPKLEGNPFVFAGRGQKAINGFSAAKRALDEKSQVAGWVLHDLRRTAKTLMRRAKVDREISERVLGHTISGVEGVYDRHDYTEEKAEALEALANLISNIVSQRPALSPTGTD